MPVEGMELRFGLGSENQRVDELVTSRIEEKATGVE